MADKKRKKEKKDAPAPADEEEGKDVDEHPFSIGEMFSQGSCGAGDTARAQGREGQERGEERRGRAD